MYAYNPRKLTHEQLHDYFVGRWGLVNKIKSELNLTPGQSPRQHWMIVGPRGMGKSHLLTLLYYEVKTDLKLRDLWIPILFPEELMNVYRIADFLERTLKEIAFELEAINTEVAGELRGYVDKIKGTKADARADYCFSLLTWVHKKTGRFILLLAENLQQMLGKRFSVIDQKKLRAYLQTSDAALIIGSATTIFKEIRDHALPFYNFFHTSTLEELTIKDIRLLVNKLLADCDKAKSSPDLDTKLRTICALAGGNPRMVVFLADIIKASITPEVLDIMDRLLDELTPYFNAIFADLPENMLKIINVMAEHEPALSPSKIAELLEMSEAMVRNYMKTLKDDGYVRIALKKGTSHYYCLNEYMYRIWFQMRDSGHREELRWLIEFLLMLYGPAVVSDKARRLIEGEVGEVYSPLIRDCIIKAAEFIYRNEDYCKFFEPSHEFWSGRDEEEISESIKELLIEALAHAKSERYDEAIDICKKAIEINPNDYSAYGVWGGCLTRLKRYDEAIDMYKKAIEINPNDYSAYGVWGECLTRLKRYDEAIDMYKKAIEINPNYYQAYWLWGYCLTRLERYDDAIDICKKAIEINPNGYQAYVMWGECLTRLERYDDAIDMYKKAIEINPNYYQAYWLWGYCLTRLERYDDAIDICKKAIEINPNGYQAYVMWGECLTRLERYDEATLAYIQIFLADESLFFNQIRNDSYSEAINSALTLLSPGTYIEQVYAKEGNAKHSKSILLTFLVLLGKYDIVEEHLGEIIDQTKTIAPSEGIELLFTAIKLSIYLNLPQQSTGNISRLLPMYTTYIKSLLPHDKQEHEIKNLTLGIYKLYLIDRANKEAIDKALDYLKTSAVPFDDSILKIWTCISNPDSTDAKLYMIDKALSEVVKALRASI
ncbi:MAG: tetratricopeptide repeat protein [Magnetococcales bacterium]|nr:tetratricopeptide repeat protein [Nitrospirota bacterium]